MAGKPKGLPKSGGRKAGTPNKVSKVLKDDILEAANSTDHGDRISYLRWVAVNHATAFVGLLGKVIPLEVTGEDGGPVDHSITVKYD